MPGNFFAGGTANMTTIFFFGFGAVGCLIGITNFIQRLNIRKGKGMDTFADDLGKYRQLQILVTVQNECFRTIFFNVAMPVVISICVLSTYAVIELHKNVSIVFVLFFIVEAADTFLVIVLVYSPAGAVYFYSEQVIQGWRRLCVGEKGRGLKQIRRKIMSANRMKIKMASANYVDRQTAFSVLDFSLQTTVAMSLIRKR